MFCEFCTELWLTRLREGIDNLLWRKKCPQFGRPIRAQPLRSSQLPLTSSNRSLAIFKQHYNQSHLIEAGFDYRLTLIDGNEYDMAHLRRKSSAALSMEQAARKSAPSGRLIDSLHIGQRVSYGGDLCTVRYAGKVKGTKGEWVGVEWDDPSRGKHSGEIDGVRYFDCAPCPFP